MEQIDYNLLFRWFVGLPMDAQVWHATVFCHNRDRLLETDVAREFLVTLMGLAEVRTLLSREHFSVDGEATAGEVVMPTINAFDPLPRFGLDIVQSQFTR